MEISCRLVCAPSEPDPIALASCTYVPEGIKDATYGKTQVHTQWTPSNPGHHPWDQMILLTAQLISHQYEEEQHHPALVQRHFDSEKKLLAALQKQLATRKHIHPCAMTYRCLCSAQKCTLLCPHAGERWS